MERKLASVQVVTSVEPIPGADAIERAQVLGWQVVVKKGAFKPMDRVVYCEVDSLLPERDVFEFLRPRGFRIKIIRLRGCVSQGICFPVSILPNDFDTESIVVGQDVTDILGIKKYEPYIPAQLAGLVKGTFPPFLHKTDEIRIQSVPGVVSRHCGKMFYTTEKLDGSSVTFYLNDGTFGVCSRNLELKETDDNSFWRVARELDIEARLRALGRNICLQGELVGPGVQGNKYRLDKLTVFFFNVFDILTQRYMDYIDFVGLIRRLGLTTVPLLGTFTLTQGVEGLIGSAVGRSVLNPDIQREGIIWRPIAEEQDEDLGRLSFKALNEDFLLAYSE